MSLDEQRVHILTTSFDYETSQPEPDRIGHIFQTSGAEKIYILYNGNTLSEEHETKEQNSLNGMKETIKQYTKAGEKGGIHAIAVDFYDFEDALVKSYKIIYEEIENENNSVYVNLTGGTKPVAIALAFASAITDIETSPYYVGKQPVDAGVLDSEVPLSTLKLLDVAEILPEDEEKEFLITSLSGIEDESIGVTDLLISQNEIPEDPSENVDEPGETRSSKIQRFHRHANALEEDNLLFKTGGEIKLTDSGNVVAKLLKARSEING